MIGVALGVNKDVAIVGGFCSAAEGLGVFVGTDGRRQAF